MRARPLAGRRPAPAWLAAAAWLLLVATAVPWRLRTFFSGQTDGTVIAKAALVLLAAGLALGVASGLRSLPAVIRRRPALAAFGAYLAVAGVAAVAAPRLSVPSVVVVLRLALYTGVAMLVLLRLGGRGLIAVHVAALAALTVTACVQATAAPLPVWKGRLGGVVPPLHPNDVALGLAVVALTAVLLLRRTRVGRWAWALAALALAGIWQTGSRTGLLATLLAALLGAAAARVAVRHILVGVLCAAAVVALAVVVRPAPAEEFFLRGGTDSVRQLNSRSVAWAAVRDDDRSPVELLVGQGLAVKDIAVVAANRSRRQGFDSTWVSGFVQTGVLGLAALLVLLVLLVREVARDPDDAWRSLRLAVLALLVLRSPLESGLFDVSASHLTLLAVALSSPPAPSGDKPQPASTDAVVTNAVGLPRGRT